MKAKLGIALSGGGARGIIHIGILRTFSKKIKIDALSGTSSGAIVAASYACGTLDLLEEYVTHLTRKEFIHFGDPAFSCGIFHGNHFQKWLNTITLGKRFEDLKISLAIVSADLKNGKQVVFTKGPLNTAIRASCSVPGIFTPLKYKGMLLVDGGIVNNMPVDILPQLGADIVVGIDAANQSGFFSFLERTFRMMKKISMGIDGMEWKFRRTGFGEMSSKLKSRLDLMARERLKNEIIKNNISKIKKLYPSKAEQKRLEEKYTVRHILSKALKTYYSTIKINKEEEADLIITPRFADISSVDFFKGKEAIELGRMYAQHYIPLIKMMLKEF